jgi:membrane fusion protein (multidrug efflux system)
LPDGSAYPQAGKIDFVSAQIDPTTDSLTVRAVVPNDFSQGRDGALVPGQYVPVRVILGEQPDALLIPQAALMQTQAGNQVLVVDQDDKVASRKVEVGPAYQGQWVIESGLKEGERVIVEGLQKARPGVVVAPKPMAAESA